MPHISPTAEGFRAAFRRPSLTLAEITWRWAGGATALTLAGFGVLEYLRTLIVTNRELFLLGTRQPLLVGRVIWHILQGGINRFVLAFVVGAIAVTTLWVVAAALGRLLTVGELLAYFATRRWTSGSVRPSPGYGCSVRGLAHLNFLRTALALASVLGLVAAVNLAHFISSDNDPHPTSGFFLFVSVAAIVACIWWALNWWLSLAEIFVVREATDALTAISAAVTFGRECSTAVFAVSAWTGLAHLVLFVVATNVALAPLGLLAVVPWRLVTAWIIAVTLGYFAVVDWLYMARLAGYVCITEMPHSLAMPLPIPPSPVVPAERSVPTAIDRDELILSDI